MPRLSVIVPTYNCAQYLPDALRSILDQEISDWEAIIVDGGSTDGTAEVMASFAHDPRIRYLQQRSKGLAAARNEGVETACGEWLAFLDADDLWHPAFGRRLLDAAAVDAGLGVVCCGWQCVDVDGRRLGPPRHADPESLAVSQLLRRNAIPIMAAIVRRTSLEQVGLFDPDLPAPADWDLWLRLAQAGIRFGFVPDVLAAYRQTPGSMSRDFDLVLGQSLAVLRKFFARPDLPPDIRALEQTARGLCTLSAAAQVLEAGGEEQGLRRLAQACCEYPALLQDMDTYYQIVCSGQPRVFWGTGEQLDLGAGERRLRRVLDLVSTALPQGRPPQRGPALRLGFLALGELALQQGRRGTAAAYALRSLARRGERWASLRSCRLLLKAAAGEQLVATAKRLSGASPTRPPSER